MRYVTGVRYMKDYQVLVTFDDGVAKLVDLEKHLDGEVFEPLRDKRRFRTAHLNPDTETVCWANGADMAPEFLYEVGRTVASRPRQRRAAGA
jgi:hypothetical protein